MTTSHKLLWLLLLCCACIAATKPRLYSPKDTPARVLVMVVAPHYRDIPWMLPARASNCWWNLQSSVDLAHWQTVQSNVTGIVCVTNARPCEVFRLQGRLTQ